MLVDRKKSGRTLCNFIVYLLKYPFTSGKSDDFDR